MISLDMKTVIFSFVLINIISTVVIVFLWRQFRNRYEGTVHLVYGFMMQLIAYVLIILRSHVPQWLSIDVANALSLIGIYAGLLGFQKFTGKRVSDIPSIITIVLLATSHIFFSYIFPMPTARYLIVSSGYFLLFGQCAWFLLKSVPEGMASLTKHTGYVFVGLAILAAIKITDYIIRGDMPVDYFRSGTMEAVIMVIYQMLVILLTVTIVLMLNNNLMRDIKTEEEKFSTTFHTAPNALVLASFPDGKLLEVNDGFTELTGYTPGECVGKSFLHLNLWKDDEEREELIVSLKSSGALMKREIQLRKKTGDFATGLLSAKMISQNSKKSVILSLYDITDRKKSEKELVMSKERAEESDKLKTAFLHNISHEIRTPMNAIVGFSNLLSDPALSPPERETYIDIISRSSKHLLSIVNDVVEISNIEAGRVRLSLSEIDPGKLLNDIYRQFRTIAAGKNIELKLEYQGASDKMLTDASKLTQVLSNLLNNALKFTLQGSVAFGYERKGDFMEFHVSDTGVGINPSYHEKIFERFYQVDNTITREHEGTGIGLSISKAFVEHLGGRIWLESEPGYGSVFWFTVPVISKNPD